MARTTLAVVRLYVLVAAAMLFLLGEDMRVNTNRNSMLIVQKNFEDCQKTRSGIFNILCEKRILRKCHNIRRFTEYREKRSS